jgi:hypothetical protein
MNNMKTIEVYGTTWHKVNIAPLSFIEALINDFLGDYRNWIKEENGSFYIMNEDCHNIESEVRCISREEYFYYAALKEAKKFLSKQHDAELQKEREFEEFRKK